MNTENSLKHQDSKKLRLKHFIQNFGFLFNRHKKSGKPNVLIFSIPRSGSTWLLELIWSQPGFKNINEPLNLKTERLQKKSGIRGFGELYSENAKEKVLNYFNGFAEGKYHFLNPNPFSKNAKIFTNRIVYKVIHGAEGFINDIAKHTNSKIVYLIRNPVAVSLSRQQLPRVDELTSDYVLSTFTLEEENYAKNIMRSGNPMEKRIMAWCIQNKFALSKKTDDWLVISYESLTCFPERIITALARHCELPNADLMMSNVNVPSAVTTQSSDDSIKLMKEVGDDRKYLISKWRDKITEEETNRYYDICKKMNFDLYKAGLDFPDLDILNNLKF